MKALLLASVLLASFPKVIGQPPTWVATPDWVAEFLRYNRQCQSYHDTVIQCMLRYIRNMMTKNCGHLCPKFSEDRLAFVDAAMRVPRCLECLRNMPENRPPSSRAEGRAMFDRMKSQCPEFKIFTDEYGCEELLRAANPK